MTLNDELTAARELYANIAKAFDKSNGVESVMESGYETDINEIAEKARGGNMAWDINVVGDNASINIVVTYDNETDTFSLDRRFSLVSRVCDDWDGLYAAVPLTNDEFIKQGYEVVDHLDGKALVLRDPDTGRISSLVDPSTKGTAVRFRTDKYRECDYYGDAIKTHEVQGKTFQVTCHVYKAYRYDNGVERPFGAVNLIGEDGQRLTEVPTLYLELAL